MNNDTKIKMCKRYDCLYSPGENAHNGCDYFLVTGEYRNCPNGKNCTKYKHAAPQEKRREAMQPMKWLSYEQGHKLIEIVKKYVENAERKAMAR